MMTAMKTQREVKGKTLLVFVFLVAALMAAGLLLTAEPSHAAANTGKEAHR